MTWQAHMTKVPDKHQLLHISVLNPYSQAALDDVPLGKRNFKTYIKIKLSENLKNAGFFISILSWGAGKGHIYSLRNRESYNHWRKADKKTLY